MASPEPRRAESQTRLLDLARDEPDKALALLGQVTAPDLAEDRDRLRERALRRRTETGRP